MLLFHPRNPSRCLKKIRIMAVDNDRAGMELMLAVLDGLGFKKTLGLCDGYKAVQALQEREFDLLITDWELKAPEKYQDALDEEHIEFYLVKYIRKSESSPNPYLPILMLAGLGFRDRLEFARDCGVNAVLFKPLNVADLCEQIGELIDHPRPFVTSYHYRGPCRRRDVRPYQGQIERRRQDAEPFRVAG